MPTCMYAWVPDEEARQHLGQQSLHHIVGERVMQQLAERLCATNLAHHHPDQQRVPCLEALFDHVRRKLLER